MRRPGGLLRIAPAVVWAALCAVLLLFPGESVKPPQEGLSPLEDPVHAVLALVLALCVGWAIAGRGVGGGAGLAAGLAAAYLLGLELAQELVPGRGWEWSDAALTVAGAAVGALLLRRAAGRPAPGPGG